MTASDASWFIRRGKQIKGPFSTEKLQSLKERGRLNDDDELSQDRSNWQTVAALAVSQAQASPAGDDRGYSLRGGGGAAAVDSVVRETPAWFYAMGQDQRGPVDASQLQQMLHSGELTAAALVWRDGFASWISISDVPELAGLANAGGRSYGDRHAAAPAGEFDTPGMQGVPRTAASVAILSFFTLGFYLIVWYFATRREMVAAGANVPPAWQMFIPFWNLYWYWTWATGVSHLTRGGTPAAVVYISWMLQVLFYLPTLGIVTAAWAGWMQHQLNLGDV